MLIEEWPIELWIELFAYTSTYDLIFGWFNLNTYLNGVISLGLHSFDLDENWTRSAFVYYINHIHSGFAPSIRRIIFRNTTPTRFLLSNIHKLRLFRNVRRLTICNGCIRYFSDRNLIGLLQQSSELRELIIEFDGRTQDLYHDTLVLLMKNNLSFHTMRMYVTDGAFAYFCKSYYSSLYENCGDAYGTYLAHTVRLTLSLNRWPNLVMLVQVGRLPLLEELDVTFEQKYPYIIEQSNDIDDRISSVDLSRLRSLRICNAPLNAVRHFIRYVPSLTIKLKSLALIRVQIVKNDNDDTTINALIDFRILLTSCFAVKLLCLQLSFYIPLDEILLDRILQAFHDEWSWPALRYQSEQCNDRLNTPQRVYALYMSYPISCRRRRPGDQDYVQQLHWPLSGKLPRHIKWTLLNDDQTQLTSANVDACLENLAHLNSLDWYIGLYPGPILAHLQKQSNRFPLWSNIRDVRLEFNQDVLPSRRVGILGKLLESACLLTSLIVPWSDVLNLAKNSKKTYPTIRRLHLLLSFGRDWRDDTDVDVMVLLDPSAIAYLFPCLLYLCTSGERPRGRFRLEPLDTIVSLVLTLLAHLSPNIRLLYLNNCGEYLQTSIALPQAKQQRLCEVLKSKLLCAASVTIRYSDGLRIWL